MKRLYFLIVLSILFFPFIVKASNIEYTLYDSNIEVNQDRTLNVNENYKIYFIEDTQKITRNIDLKLNQVDPSNKKTYINGVLSNVNSDSKTNVESKDKMTKITMNVQGSQDETSEYSLNYNYNLGKDTSNKNDELFYDIVSNVDASISNLTFSITLPSSIDKKNIYFSINGKYNLTADDINYTVEDNKIVGSLNKLLEANEKFSVYIKLPNNYFVGATDNFNYLNFLVLIIPILGSIILLIYWIKYGMGNKLRVKRTSEIPYNFDSAEIGYLFKGKCEEMDLTSDLLFLANHGYLKIVENDDGYKLGKENSFKLVKLKDYDLNNAAQEIIFVNLFRDKDVVEMKDIEYHFADSFKEAKSMLDNPDNNKKLFFLDIEFRKMIALLFIAISSFIVNFTPVHMFMNNYWLIPIMWLLFILSLYVLFLSSSNLFSKIVIGGGLLIACFYVAVIPIIPEKRLLVIYIIGILLIFLMCILYKKLPNRTKYGNKVLGETYGLKYYLENITKKELEEKLQENDNFYYNMIPYAYVLDSLGVWIKKGKGIIEQPPVWYIPSSEFNISTFEQFIKNFLYTTTLVMMKQTYSEYGNIQYSNDKIKTNLND